MAQSCIGDCTRCGASEVNVTIINDEDRVCDSCLEEAYLMCDECEEYYEEGSVEFYDEEDGRILCEFCHENLEDDEEDDD